MGGYYCAEGEKYNWVHFSPLSQHVGIVYVSVWALVIGFLSLSLTISGKTGIVASLQFRTTSAYEETQHSSCPYTIYTVYSYLGTVVKCTFRGSFGKLFKICVILHF